MPIPWTCPDGVPVVLAYIETDERKTVEVGSYDAPFRFEHRSWWSRYSWGRGGGLATLFFLKEHR